MKVKFFWCTIIDQSDQALEIDQGISSGTDSLLSKIEQGEIGVANMATDNTKNFKLLYSAYLGIMESILASGSGESYDSAFVVVSAHDEYSVLRYLGLQSKGQALSHHKGQSCDILSTVDPELVEKDIYFNIDIPWESLSNSFSNDSGSHKKNDRKRKK